MNKIAFLIFLLPVTLFITGCGSTGRPTPDMTRMGAGTGPGGEGATAGGGAGSTTQGDLGDFGLGDNSLTNRGTSVAGLEDAPPYASVYFDFDRSYIRETERSVLNDTAKYLLQNPSQRVLIEGHCDWKGTTDYNLALGDRRANSVKSYLVELGVTPSLIEILSKGDLDAVEGADDAARQLDRRADIILIP